MYLFCISCIAEKQGYYSFDEGKWSEINILCMYNWIYINIYPIIHIHTGLGLNHCLPWETGEAELQVLQAVLLHSVSCKASVAEFSRLTWQVKFSLTKPTQQTEINRQASTPSTIQIPHAHADWYFEMCLLVRRMRCRCSKPSSFFKL